MAATQAPRQGFEPRLLGPKPSVLASYTNGDECRIPRLTLGRRERALDQWPLLLRREVPGRPAGLPGRPCTPAGAGMVPRFTVAGPALAAGGFLVMSQARHSFSIPARLRFTPVREHGAEQPVYLSALSRGRSTRRRSRTYSARRQQGYSLLRLSRSGGLVGPAAGVEPASSPVRRERISTDASLAEPPGRVELPSPDHKSGALAIMRRRQSDLSPHSPLGCRQRALWV